MLQRVPQKYLASYLNIKPETFSRMKHLGRETIKLCTISVKNYKFGLIRINNSLTYGYSSKLMSHQKSFLDFLNKFIPLSLDEYNELIVPCVIKRNFDKKSIITTAGEVENYINFIDSAVLQGNIIKKRTKRSIHKFLTKVISFIHRNLFIAAHLLNILLKQ